MTFDDQLRDLAATLTERLRREAAGHLQDAVANLQESARAERETAVADAVREARDMADRDAREHSAAAVAEAIQQTRDVAAGEAAEHLRSAVADAEARSYAAGLADGRKEGREQGLAEGKQEGRDEGREEGKQAGRAEGRDPGRKEGFDEGAPGSRPAAVERIVAAMRLIDQARSLSEILDALTTAARREAGAAAVMLVRGDQLRSWRLVGFGRALDEAVPFDVPLSDAGLLGQAVRTSQPVLADSTNEDLVPGFASLPSGRTMFAAPVELDGEVVAVLYGEQGEASDAHEAWPQSLEIIVRHAARALEAVTAFRAASLLAGDGSIEKARSAPVNTLANGDTLLLGNLERGNQ